MAGRLRPGGYLARLRHEIKAVTADPAEGVHCWPRDSDNESMATVANSEDGGGFWLDAVITPASDTPYARGSFSVECCLPREFTTPIYHPNIDGGGRICVDILKEGNSPGRWNASCNLRMVLCIIRQLLSEPNPDDPLNASAAKLYLADRARFNQEALEMTIAHAVSKGPGSTNDKAPSPFTGAEAKPAPPEKENVQSKLSAQSSTVNESKLPTAAEQNSGLSHPSGNTAAPTHACKRTVPTTVEGESQSHSKRYRFAQPESFSTGHFKEHRTVAGVGIVSPLAKLGSNPGSTRASAPAEVPASCNPLKPAASAEESAALMSKHTAVSFVSGLTTRSQPSLGLLNSLSSMPSTGQTKPQFGTPAFGDASCIPEVNSTSKHVSGASPPRTVFSSASAAQSVPVCNTSTSSPPKIARLLTASAETRDFSGPSGTNQAPSQPSLKSIGTGSSLFKTFSTSRPSSLLSKGNSGVGSILNQRRTTGGLFSRKP